MRPFLAFAPLGCVLRQPQLDAAGAPHLARLIVHGRRAPAGRSRQPRHQLTEPLQQLAFVYDRGPEEVDPLANVPDASAAAEHVGHVHRAEKRVQPLPERRIVRPAVLDICERHAKLVEDFAGGKCPAERVAKPRAIQEGSFVARTPEKRRHAELVRDHPDGPLRAEVAVRDKQAAYPLGLEVVDDRLHVGLIPNNAVLQHALQVDRWHLPLAETLPEGFFLPKRVLVAEDELADWAQPKQRFGGWIHVVTFPAGSPDRGISGDRRLSVAEPRMRRPENSPQTSLPRSRQPLRRRSTPAPHIVR